MLSHTCHGLESTLQQAGVWCTDNGSAKFHGATEGDGGIPVSDFVVVQQAVECCAHNGRGACESRGTRNIGVVLEREGAFLRQGDASLIAEGQKAAAYRLPCPLHMRASELGWQAKKGLSWSPCLKQYAPSTSRVVADMAAAVLQNRGGESIS